MNELQKIREILDEKKKQLYDLAKERKQGKYILPEYYFDIYYDTFNKIESIVNPTITESEK